MPTGEVLPDGKWSGTVYRRGTNWIQGYTNVADFAGTFAYGLKDRAEIFGSFLVDTRIDRDIRPIFVNDPAFGGIIDRYPQANKYWSGDHLGDLYLGAKVNLWSEYRQNPAALAVRGIVKVPTGKVDAGVSTGKPDFSFDFLASKEASKMVEVSGFGGYEFRGSPDGIDAPTGAFRWGTGVAFPSRNPLRISAELNGFVPSNDVATITGASIVGTDLTRAPVTSNTENITRATLGLTYQAKSGFFAGAGLSWNVPSRARSGSFTDEPDVVGDYYDMQFRIGYHPGVAVYVPPPPPRAPEPQAPVHNLTVKADCNPCTVEVGMSSTVTATVQDSIGCAVTYRWTTPTGTLAQPAERSTRWTAPDDTGFGAGHGHGDVPDRQQDGVGHGEHPGHGPAAAEEALRLRGRALRLRPLLAAAGSDAGAGRSDRGDEAGRDAEAGHRRAHVQHRHGGVQPGAGRSPGERRPGLPREPRRQRRSAPDHQLRRRTAEVRQRAGRDAPTQPPRRARCQSSVRRNRGARRDRREYFLCDLCGLGGFI